MGTASPPIRRAFGPLREEAAVADATRREKAPPASPRPPLAEGMAVRRPRFNKTPGHDPDSLRVEKGEEALAKVIEEVDFVHLMTA
jgi:hypothetical protein